jgi:hypothetical protein
MGTGSGLPPRHLAPPSLGRKRLRVRAHASALGKTIRSKPPNPGGFVAGYLSFHRGRGLAGELLLFFFSLSSNWAKARSQILLPLSLIDLRRTTWKNNPEDEGVYAQQHTHTVANQKPAPTLNPPQSRHLQQATDSTRGLSSTLVCHVRSSTPNIEPVQRNHLQFPIHYRHLSSVISFGMPPPKDRTTHNREQDIVPC